MLITSSKKLDTIICNTCQSQSLSTDNDIFIFVFVKTKIFASCLHDLINDADSVRSLLEKIEIYKFKQIGDNIFQSVNVASTEYKTVFWSYLVLQYN